jgi:hypothetical protein
MRERSRGGEEGFIYRELCCLRDELAYVILSNQRIDGHFQRSWLSLCAQQTLTFARSEFESESDHFCTTGTFYMFSPHFSVLTGATAVADHLVSCNGHSMKHLDRANARSCFGFVSRTSIDCCT